MEMLDALANAEVAEKIISSGAEKPKVPSTPVAYECLAQLDPVTTNRYMTVTEEPARRGVRRDARAPLSGGQAVADARDARRLHAGHARADARRLHARVTAGPKRLL